jgi:hypothetical protein
MTHPMPSRNPGENASSTDGATTVAHVHPLIYDNLVKPLFMIEI